MKQNSLTTGQIGQKFKTAAQLIDQTRSGGGGHRVIDWRYAANFQPFM
jgi:hypothetical protein